MSRKIELRIEDDLVEFHYTNLKPSELLLMGHVIIEAAMQMYGKPVEIDESP